jgi:hypothetical protein
MYSRDDWKSVMEYNSIEDMIIAEQDERNAKLLLAIEVDRMDIFEYYLGSGADPRHDSDKALVEAVKHENFDFVERLLKLECDPRSNNNEAFLEAVRQNDIQLIKKFIALGCDPRARDHEALFVKTFTHYDTRVLKLLINVGCDPRARDNALLRYAIEKSDVKFVEYLFSIGCELSFKDEQKFESSVKRLLLRSYGFEIINLIMKFGYNLTYATLAYARIAAIDLAYARIAAIDPTQQRNLFNCMIKREQIKYMIFEFGCDNEYNRIVHGKQHFLSIPIEHIVVSKFYSNVAMKGKIIAKNLCAKNNLLKNILRPRTLHMQMILIM